MISSVTFRTSKIAQELKALATKPTVLSLNPGDHVEDERDCLLSSSDPHMNSKSTQVNVKQCLKGNMTFRHTPPPTPFHSTCSY